jgi:allantoate deiminase
MKSYKHRAEKIEDRIEQLASYSDEEEGLTRLFGTKAFTQARDTIKLWMEEAGLQTSIDNIGNVRGKLVCKKTDPKIFVIGSHYDTVVNAGKYDGVMGLLAGLDIIEHLIEAGRKIPFNIELIAFSDREGLRFHSSYLGSKVIAGRFDINSLDDTDNDGITLQQAISGLEYDGTRLLYDAIPAEKWLGYFEIHVEQGPVLYKKDIPAAIVTGIAGRKKISIEFNGVSGYAGTVPMNIRKDALCAAAEFIVAAERLAAAKKSNLIATIGKLEVDKAASNVIPSKVLCTLDLRSGNKKKFTRAYEELNELCEEICNNRKIYFEWKLLNETNPIDCDEYLKKLLKKAIKEREMEVFEMLSGSGHDATVISEVAPVAMLFVKSFKGISHDPLEKVEIKDLAIALEISDNFIEELIEQPVALDK